MQAYDGSALEVPARWWRAGRPRQPRLAWLFEWTDAGILQNGYSDEAGDADARDIAEVVTNWMPAATSAETSGSSSHGSNPKKAPGSLLGTSGTRSTER